MSVERRPSRFTTRAILAAALALGPSPAAQAADICKDVTIRLKNATRTEIKVTKFEYLEPDGPTWRTENLFGPEGYQRLAPGRTWPRTISFRRLAGEASTKLRATYKPRRGRAWGPDKIVTTVAFICHDGLHKQMTLDK